MLVTKEPPWPKTIAAAVTPLVRGKIELEHAVVEGVGDIQIARHVERDAGRSVQGRSADTAGVGELAGEGNLPEHDVRGGIIDERCVEFERAIVGGIGDVKIASRINRDTFGRA